MDTIATDTYALTMSVTSAATDAITQQDQALSPSAGKTNPPQ